MTDLDDRLGALRELPVPAGADIDGLRRRVQRRRNRRVTRVGLVAFVGIVATAVAVWPDQDSREVVVVGEPAPSAADVQELTVFYVDGANAQGEANQQEATFSVELGPRVPRASTEWESSLGRECEADSQTLTVSRAGEEVQIGDACSWLTPGVASPDGRWLAAFTALDGAAAELHVIELDETPADVRTVPRSVTTGYTAAWTDDGQLWFTNDGAWDGEGIDLLWSVATPDATPVSHRVPGVPAGALIYAVVPADQPSDDAGSVLPEEVAPVPSPGEPMQDGTHLVFISAVDLGRNLIEVDVAEWLAGDRADAAYFDETGDDTGAPNDYYIRNADRELRQLQLSSPRVSVAWDADGPRQHEIDLSDLDLYLAERQDPQAPFWVSIEDGVVTHIVEMYRP